MSIGKSIQRIFRLDSEEIRNLMVSDKFKKTFQKIQAFTMSLVIVMAITLGAAWFGFSRMYNKNYQSGIAQGDIRTDLQALKAKVWIALSTQDQATRDDAISGLKDNIRSIESNINFLKKYITKEQYETFSSNLKTLESQVDEMNALYSSATFNAQTLEPSNALDIYRLLHDDMGTTISDLAAIMKEVNIGMGGSSSRLWFFGRIVIVVMALLSILVVVLNLLFLRDARRKLTDSILIPVEEIHRASQEMAKGKLNLTLNYESADELGALSSDLKKSTGITRDALYDMGENLGRVAQGDFTSSTSHPELYIGDYESIKEYLDNIVQTLSHTLSQVKESSNQVSSGAYNMSQGANDLAEGATDQAAVVEELTASVNTVNEQTQILAETAEKGASMSDEGKKAAEASAQKMRELTEAMERITDASKEIENVTNTIESIASQTQLLALNASIEAARAGEAGRGFAVVAEEIGNLAAQSNEAVSNTHELVNTTLSEIENGNRVVNDTTEVMARVQETVEQVSEMMRQSGEMARNQATSMNEINAGIEQISDVIQNNSATAEESSAVSQELSEQSETLNQLIDQFKVLS